MFNDEIYKKLLNAGELFHYADRFRHQCFTIVFRSWLDFEVMIEDLKVLQSAQIRLAIFFKNPNDSELKNRLESLCRFNTQFAITKSLAQEPTASRSLIYLPEHLESSSILESIKNCQSRKLIFINIYPQIDSNEKPASYCTPAEWLAYSSKDENYDSLLEYAESLDSKTNIVLLKAEPGELFKEVFTHVGSGTLIASDYEIKFEKASLQHASDIYYLILSYVVERIMLPVSREEILRSIDNFYILSIDDSVVASLLIKPYGKACELAKLCTLPRYRKLGLAKNLIAQVIESFEKDSDKSYCFALSNNSKVVDLFVSLGFERCERKSLPELWQSQYDFSRHSEACRFSLKS